MNRNRTLMLVFFVLGLSVLSTIYADCLPLLHLGTDPDDVKYDRIDMKELYCTTNTTHITFLITCYGEVETRKKSPTLPRNEFRVYLDVVAGWGDNRRNAPLEGADVIIEAHSQRVYWWNGKRWERKKTLTAQVEVKGNNITVTCQLSDIQFEEASGDIRICFISKLKGSKGLKKVQDRAPDRGWYTLEGGISGLTFLEISAAGLLGLTLASRVRKRCRRVLRDSEG